MSHKNNKDIIHRYEKLREYRLSPSFERNEMKILTKQGMADWIITWGCLNRPEELRKEHNSVVTKCLNPKTIDGFMFNEAITIMSSMIQEKLRGVYECISKDT